MTVRSDYWLGCKRTIQSNDFYPALARPVTELVTCAIESVTLRGVLTADGREHALDRLVCATGFDVQHALSHVAITSRDGRTAGGGAVGRA